MKNYTGRASELRNNADVEIRQIQSNNDLTQTAKAKRIAEIRVKTNEKLNAFGTEHRKAQAEHRDNLHRRLFGLSYPGSATEADRQAAKLNYRDALFRADSIADEATALRLLGRAQMTGDKELAKAIASVSYENGWGRALNDYTAQSEALQEDLNELLSYEQNLGNAQIRMTESMSFSQIHETPEEQKARMSGELSKPSGAEVTTKL